jgi:lactocepin
MGADVINMSLGVDIGNVGEENDPIQKAIRVATEIVRIRFQLML